VPDRAVAVVELTTGQATSAGYRVRVAEYEIGDVAGAALYADGYTGHAQMVVDEDRRVILGVTMPPMARGPFLSHDQRSLAAPP